MSDHEDYAHIHDRQSQRARRELWVILAIVFVVVVGGLVWRIVAHVPPKPQVGWGPAANTASTDVIPAAAAGVHPQAPPPPRPAGP